MLEVNYSHRLRKLKVTAEVVIAEPNNLNSSSKTFYKFLTTDLYDKCIKFDDKKVIDEDIVDIRVIGKGIIDIKDPDVKGNLSENTKHYYTDKPDFIILTWERDHTVITPTYYFDSLFAPIFEEVVQFYKGNMQKVESELSSGWAK